MKPLLCGLVALGVLAAVAGQADADYVFTNLESNNPTSEPVSPTAINNLGQIVGFDQTGLRGFLLSGKTYMTLGGSDQAWGINDAGYIVGQYIFGKDFGGFLYHGGSYSDFPRTPLYGINNSGQIVGVTGSNGLLLSPQGGSTIFAVPGSTLTVPYKINDSDQVVGFYIRNFATHGFLLSAGDYTTLPGATIPYGINNAGLIVGEDLNGTHGFLFSDGGYTRIEPPGSLASGAFGINDAGQIVGFYIDGAGVAHGYLATPTPEPATLLLLAIATPVLIGFTWRRTACCEPFFSCH